MGLVSRAIVAGQFKVGVLQAKQITRIENGGLVIACSDSRYQPGNGIRYEITPDEWFLHTYAFFPRHCSKEVYERDFLKHKLYYDYFSDVYPTSPKRRSYSLSIFAIFKNGYDTGYRIEEALYSADRGEYSQITGKRYWGLHINEWGLRRYKMKKDHMEKPFVEAKYIGEAAIYMMSDLEDFEPELIDLKALIEDCDDSPGSCVLHDQLAIQLDKCKYRNKYIKGIE